MVQERLKTTGSKCSGVHKIDKFEKNWTKRMPFKP